MNIRIRHTYNESIEMVTYTNVEKVETSADYSTFTLIIDGAPIATYSRKHGMCYDIIMDEAEMSELEATEAVEEMSESEIAEAVEEMHACEKYGAEMAKELFESSVYRKLTFSVNGSTWNTNETEKLVYRSMGKDLAVSNAGDLVSAYCDAHGIKWGTIEDVHISHHEYGNSRGGHYIISAYVGERIEE